MVKLAAPVIIETMASATRFSLRLPAETANGIRTAASFRFDRAINTCVADGERLSVHLGPDEWLLLAPQNDRESARSEIASSLASGFFSLVDVSDASVAFVVSGIKAADVLNAGCPLDLDGTAFPAGSATRTLFGKAEIILIRPSQRRSFRLECLRSFAPYVHALLQDASLEFMVTTTT